MLLPEAQLTDIEQILEFMQQIEQLKAVVRKTQPIGLSRMENSAEHSWHVCVSALMLKEHANSQVDILTVIKMLLLHDLGEIDCGDKLLYSNEHDAQLQQEQAGLERLLAYLPADQQDEYLQLWREFEYEDSAEALFARAIDRVPPLLQNLATEGGAWQRHNIRAEQVLQANAHIAQGSQALWQVMKKRLLAAIEHGWLKR